MCSVISTSVLVSIKKCKCEPKKLNFICFNKSLLNMMKNAFYFILKALFVLKISIVLC